MHHTIKNGTKHVLAGMAKAAAFLMPALLLLTACGTAPSGPAQDASSGKTQPAAQPVSSAEKSGGNDAQEASSDDTLTVSFLKVGKADAIVLVNEVPDDNGGSSRHAVLIDTGEEDDGEEVTQHLQSLGFESVDLMILTHFDKDHIGGADTVLESLDVKKIILPDYEGAGMQYEEMLKAAAGVEMQRLTGRTKETVGSLELDLLAPSDYTISGEDEYDNDFSIVTRVLHGGNTLLFTGDIEKPRILELLDPAQSDYPLQADLLKVPHHGEYNKALIGLAEAVTPKISVICDSDKNPADEKTLDLLKGIGSEVRQTRFGDITVTSGPGGLEVQQ